MLGGYASLSAHLEMLSFMILIVLGVCGCRSSFTPSGNRCDRLVDVCVHGKKAPCAPWTPPVAS